MLQLSLFSIFLPISTIYLTWYQSHFLMASNKYLWRFFALPPATSLFLLSECRQVVISLKKKKNSFTPSSQPHLAKFIPNSCLRGTDQHICGRSATIGPPTRLCQFLHMPPPWILLANQPPEMCLSPRSMDLCNFNQFWNCTHLHAQPTETADLYTHRHCPSQSYSLLLEDILDVFESKSKEISAIQAFTRPHTPSKGSVYQSRATNGVPRAGRVSPLTNMHQQHLTRTGHFLACVIDVPYSHQTYLGFGMCTPLSRGSSLLPCFHVSFREPVTSALALCHVSYP